MGTRCLATSSRLWRRTTPAWPTAPVVGPARALLLHWHRPNAPRLGPRARRLRLRPDWLHLGPQEEGGDADEGARQRPTGHVRLRWRRYAGRAHGQLLPVVLLAVGARADAAGGSQRTYKTQSTSSPHRQFAWPG